MLSHSFISHFTHAATHAAAAAHAVPAAHAAAAAHAAPAAHAAAAPATHIYLYFILPFIILLICLILLLLLCGDVEINPGPTSSTMLKKKRIDSLKAPSCVKERTPLTLVPIRDVNFVYNDIHEVSTLPNIIDVEIVQKKTF